MKRSLRGKFLIVDDDDGLLGLLKVLLETAGAETLCAPDAQTAVELLTKNQSEIRACLLDLNLDDVQGEHLYDELRSISPDLAVFPMSGCFSDEIRERLGDRQISGVITKPFMSKDLIETLSSGLSD